MGKIVMEIPDELLHDSCKVLGDLGLNVESAVKMVLKRISKDQSIDFIIQKKIENGNSQGTCQVPTLVPNEDLETSRLTKTLAVRLFKEKNFFIGKNVTFASKNRAANNYWANPDFSVLNEDWYLILNDWIKRKAYLFVIPANTINPNQLVCRSDKRSAVDLQIAYNDPSYTDNRSDFCFKKYLIDSIQY